MTLELNLRFPDPHHVIVRLGDSETASLPFTNPISDQERRDLAWYVETYGAHSLGDPDDQEAQRIAAHLSVLGKALFNAVFTERKAERLFNEFQDAESEQRLITVSADRPAILALPWELLHEPAGTWLFREKLSIRRRVAGAGRKPFEFSAKPRLHLLFVVSRPDDAGFLDPRSDTQPVLDALDDHATGRVTWEFLRPATLDALIRRLDDDALPPVDILHFDGHGVFDEYGGLPERHRQASHAGCSEAILRDAGNPHDPDSPPNTGYLLFEESDGKTDFISAAKLGENLHRRKIALVILSACQTAKLGEKGGAENADGAEGAMGGVAARLTAAGIPAVLAMTHSVLIDTTRALFGEFYRQLAHHRSIGAALDAARRHLANHPGKYLVQRGTERVPLKLCDWFIPALYQHGADLALLEKSALMEARPVLMSNLPPCPESGFFGRSRELWEIERRFAGATRRVTLTGFGGQGKTALAQEAGRWLVRTGMFHAAVFVDYSHLQAADAVAVAVNEIGAVLGLSLPNAAAVTVALKTTPTLVILDNLEALSADTLHALLTAAVPWSLAGGSKLLCTTRRPDVAHAEYRNQGSHAHRSLVLTGLGRDDALEWSAALLRLPPAPLFIPSRDSLAALFAKAEYHPLTIRVLVQQIKTRRIAEVGERLEQLLAAQGNAPVGEDTPAALVASLQLSLDRLDPAARLALPRLGVFQGGAMESDLLAITGLDAALWPALRRQLEDAALLAVETLEGVTVPYLRFHPTLAPLLWAELDETWRAGQESAFRRRYYQTARYLHHEDDRHPHQVRAIARRELPNLLHAVHGALAAGEAEAVAFANSVNWFLKFSGLKREAEQLAALAQAASGEIGSEPWVVAQSNHGEQLLAAGKIAEAGRLFADILAQLGEAPSHNRAVTLGLLGRCQGDAGRPDLAEGSYRQGLAVCAQLGQSDSVKHLLAGLSTDLADALRQQGRYREARPVYESALATAQALRDIRGQCVTQGQLGTLAMMENNPAEAARRHQEALSLFRQLNEPASEAIALHQLGVVYQQASQFEAAERHYRDAARIQEGLGDLTGAARTWNNLAQVCQSAGKPDAAQAWYRKAIAVLRQNSQPLELANSLNNLAALLSEQPARLAEARELAQEALAIRERLDPGRAEIWATYTTLAKIAAQEAAVDPARHAALESEAEDHRRNARTAWRAFPGGRQALRQYAPLIHVAVAACADHPKVSRQLAEHQAALRQGGTEWAKLADALDRLLAGERDAEALCHGQDYENSLILETILQGLADPDSLADLRPEAAE